MTRPYLTAGQRAARLLRRLAARLDDRRRDPGPPTVARSLTAVPDDRWNRVMQRGPAADHLVQDEVPRAFITAEQDPDWPLTAQLSPENAWHFARSRSADSVETACGLTLLLGQESTVTEAPGLIINCARCSSRARHPARQGGR